MQAIKVVQVGLGPIGQKIVQYIARGPAWRWRRRWIRPL